MRNLTYDYYHREKTNPILRLRIPAIPKPIQRSP